VITVIIVLAAIIIPKLGDIVVSFKQAADLRSCDNFANEMVLLIEFDELEAVLDANGNNQDAKGDVETALNSGAIDSPRIGNDFYYTYDSQTDGGTLEIFVGSDSDTKFDSDNKRDGNQFITVKVINVHSIN